MSQGQSTLSQGQSTLSQGQSTLSQGQSTLSQGQSTLSQGQSTPSHVHELNYVLFLGRTLNEYEQQFNFNEKELQGKRIVDISSGPSSFTASKIADITAVDPLYNQTSEYLYNLGMRDIMHATSVFCTNTANSHHDFTKKDYWVEKENALNQFVEDYKMRKDSKYLVGSLPSSLPFDIKDDSSKFDLLLSSHFLFCYAPSSEGGILNDDFTSMTVPVSIPPSQPSSQNEASLNEKLSSEAVSTSTVSQHFNLDFHLRSIEEFTRVANEVRIFPTCSLDPTSSDQHPYLERVISRFNELGYDTVLEETSCPVYTAPKNKALIATRKETKTEG